MENLDISIANVQSRLEFYEQYPEAPGFEIVPQLQELLPKLATERQTLEDTINNQDAANIQARNSIIADRTRQIQSERKAMEQETRSLQNQLTAARMGDNPLMQQLMESGQRTNEIIANYVDRMNEYLRESDRLQAQLDKYAEQGIQLSADELAVFEAEIQKLKEDAAAAELQGTLQIEIEIENRQRVIDDFSRNLQSSLNDAQVQSLQTRGDVFGANALQRNAGIRQWQGEYQQQSDTINYLASQPGADESQIAKMRSDLESLNQFNLDNLRMQFPDLADSINSTAFQAFQNLGTSIADVFAQARSGEDILKGLGNAFQQFAGQIIQSLLNMAAQAASSELFGLFFPQKSGAGAGGGLSGLFSTLSDANLNTASLESSNVKAGAGFSGSGGSGFDAGSAIGLISTFAGFFANGGYVDGIYQGRDDELHARLTQGEYVLNRDVTAAIGKSQLDSWNFGRNIPRFATGGYVDYSPNTQRKEYRDYNAESQRRQSSRTTEDKPIPIAYTKIGDRDYIEREEFERGMNEAAKKGAREGRDSAYKGISQNPSIRRGLGMN